VEGERDRPDVGELVGQRGDRGGEQADGLLDIVAEVDEALGPSAPLDLPEHGAELGLRKLVHRPLDARGQPGSRQSRLLDGCQHGTQPSTELRFGTIADRMSADRPTGLPSAQKRPRQGQRDAGTKARSGKGGRDAASVPEARARSVYRPSERP